MPEAVREVASVTPLRARAFRTPVGSFTYLRVPARDPRAGVRATEVARNLWAFIANPLRAIADLVYLRRGVDYDKNGLTFLTDSLRLELDELQPVHEADVEEIAISLKSRRAVAYVRGLQRELGL